MVTHRTFAAESSVAEPSICRTQAYARPSRARAVPCSAVQCRIVFVLRSRIAWNLLPHKMGCGSGTTCWRRLVAWQEAGVWQRIRETLLSELRGRGHSTWNASLSTVLRFAQCWREQRFVVDYRETRRGS
ncbi:transposase [Burkholderia ubonensis]|uniref:transposase n=1 Tax=Burkholderia ubonensis TaxID=101571 RepID=UPI0039F63517